MEEIVKSLVYQTTARPARIAADLARLRNLDHHHEKIERRWKYGGIASGAMIGVGIALTVLTADDSGAASAAFAVTILAVVATIVCFMVKSSYARGNTENRRYELMGKVIHMLSRDSADDARFRVRLDLGRPNAKSKFTGKGTAGHWNVKFYRDRWLSIAGRLLDGSTFLLDVTEKFQYRSRWKRSASGKSKHKSKTKTATEFQVRVKTKPEKYGDLQKLAPDARGAVQLAPGSTLKGCAIKGNTMSIKAGLKQPWDVRAGGERPKGVDGVEVVARIFLSVYQVLNLSRAVAKKEQA